MHSLRITLGPAMACYAEFGDKTSFSGLPATLMADGTETQEKARRNPPPSPFHVLINGHWPPSFIPIITTGLPAMPIVFIAVLM